MDKRASKAHMQMLWRNNEDHKNDDTASTLLNVSPLQGSKRGGSPGYVIESATHLKIHKNVIRVHIGFEGRA